MQDGQHPTIKGFHAHVYFDPETRDEAWALRERVVARFDKIAMGRFLERLVGPHPQFSYQIAFGPKLFGELIPWLAQERGNLRVFVHGISSDDYYDHTQLTMWLGDSIPLDLRMFNAGETRDYVLPKED